LFLRKTVKAKRGIPKTQTTIEGKATTKM